MLTTFEGCYGNADTDRAMIVTAYQQMSRDAARSGARADEIETALRSAGAGPQVAERMMKEVLDETVAALVDLRVPERQVVEKLERRGFETDQIEDAIERVKESRQPSADGAKFLDPTSMAIGIIWCLSGMAIHGSHALATLFPENLPGILLAIGGMVMVLDPLARCFGLRMVE